MLVRCSNCFYEYKQEYGMCPMCGYEEGERNSDLCSLLPGTKIMNRYIIGETIGAGGFGITYKAWDIQLETVLAIKEYFPSGMVNRTEDSGEVFLVASKKEKEFIKGKKRFLDEARNMAKFSQHHNIVNVFNYFEANNTAYIIMEYLDGMTLRKVLQKQNRPFKAEEAVSIAIAVCDALEAIHKEGILHRDISPDNIMVCKDGTIKLLDFGAARFSKEVTPETEVSIIVKPGFTPPEQYNKVNEQDARTDIYALGATLYYALTGVRPEESRDRKKEDTLVEPQSIVSEIPNYVGNAIMRAMSIEMEYRFRTAEVFRQVFEKKLDVESVEKEKSKKFRKKIGSMIAILVMIVCASILLGVKWKQNQIADGEIELWYVATGNINKDEKIAESWKAVAETFMEEYPNVVVKTTGIVESNYVEKIAEAQKNGTLPTIYESTTLPNSLLYDAKSFGKVIEKAENVYQEALEGQTKIYPTGLVVPVIYANTALGQVGKADSMKEMLDVCNDFGSTLLIDEKASEMYEKLYGMDLQGYTSNEGLTEFVNGKCFLYLGTTEDYFASQDLMKNGKGRYAIIFPETKEAVYQYGCQWSFNGQDNRTEKAVFAFLEYLNSNYVQDCFNIQNFAESGCLPVTKTGLSAFLEINQELIGIQEYLALPYYSAK